MSALVWAGACSSCTARAAWAMATSNSCWATLVVPRADEDVVAFVCDVAPEVFLGRLAMLDWLRQDVACPLHGAPPGGRARLRRTRCCSRRRRSRASWRSSRWSPAGPGRSEPEPARTAMEAASAAGHAEAATWLLARMQGVEKDAPPGPCTRPLAQATCQWQRNRAPYQRQHHSLHHHRAQPRARPGPCRWRPCRPPAPDADPHADERVAPCAASARPRPRAHRGGQPLSSRPRSRIWMPRRRRRQHPRDSPATNGRRHV